MKFIRNTINYIARTALPGSKKPSAINLLILKEEQTFLRKKKGSKILHHIQTQKNWELRIKLPSYLLSERRNTINHLKNLKLKHQMPIRVWEEGKEKNLETWEWERGNCFYREIWHFGGKEINPLNRTHCKITLGIWPL